MPKLISQADLINAEINRLHEKGSGDWQTLSRQVSKNYTKVTYNLMQFMVALAMKDPDAKFVFAECGRGAGKSTVIAEAIKNFMYHMPRSKGVMPGATFKQMLDLTLPSVKMGLELLGIFEGLHYFIGRRPPKNWKWPTCYQSPNTYDKMMSTFTGTSIMLISLEASGDGRGPNSDFLISDETAFNPKTKMDVVDSTVRGTHFKEFEDNPFFLKRLQVSSTPLDPMGFWFTDMEEVAKENPKKFKFIKASWRVNKNNLPKDYAEVARKKALFQWVYDAEYNNIRPGRVKNGFYSLLNKDIHLYTDYDYDHYQIGKDVEVNCKGDADLIPTEPLIAGIDWGSEINAMVVLQKNKREIRALKDFVAKGEDRKIQDDMIQDFIDYYSSHPKKEIYLHFDNTGNNKTGNTRRTRAQQASQQLRNAGWKVIIMTTGGKNTLHHFKYLVWEKILSEKHNQLPKFRINKGNCNNTWISMTSAKAKVSGINKEIKKDKSSEKRSTRREHATDLSDAIDTPIVQMYGFLVKNLENTTTLPHAKTSSR